MTDAAPVFSSANRLSTTCPTVRATRRGVRLQSPYGLPSTHPASTPLQSYPGIPKANSTASYLRLCLCNADVNLTPPDLCGSPAPSTAAYDAPAFQIQDGSHIRPAFAGHDEHDVADPSLILPPAIEATIQDIWGTGGGGASNPRRPVRAFESMHSHQSAHADLRRPLWLEISNGGGENRMGASTDGWSPTRRSLRSKQRSPAWGSHCCPRKR
jgi:hypothetical protein